MRPKILIIPSWYPTDANRSKGIFFWEQAQLTAERFDVRMLVGSEVIIGRKKFYKYFLPHKGKIDTFYQQNKTGLETEYFEYVLPAFLSKAAQLDLKMEAHLKKVQALMDEGWKPDLIHAHCALHGGVIAQYLSEKLNIPYIVTEHQHFIFDYFSDYTFRLTKTALENADRVLSVSRFQSRMLLMNGVACSPVVIGNLVDETLFLPGQKKSLNRFRILTIGFHTYLKDMKTFFRSLDALNKLGLQNFEAVIISPKYNGSYINYEQFADELGVLQHCSFIEELDRRKIVALFQECDVFVSTAIAETFGLSVAEALMCGKPVVVTDSGGINDFVEDGQNGFISDVGDHKSIARNIMRVQQGELPLQPEEIRNAVVEKYGREAFLHNLEHAYNSVLNQETLIANTVS